MSFVVKKRDKISFEVEGINIEATVSRMTGKQQLQIETEIERVNKMMSDPDSRDAGLKFLYEIYLDLLQSVIEDLKGTDEGWPADTEARREFLDSCGWVFVAAAFGAYFSRSKPNGEEQKK